MTVAAAIAVIPGSTRDPASQAMALVAMYAGLSPA